MRLGHTTVYVACHLRTWACAWTASIQCLLAHRYDRTTLRCLIISHKYVRPQKQRLQYERIWLNHLWKILVVFWLEVNIYISKFEYYRLDRPNSRNTFLGRWTSWKSHLIPCRRLEPSVKYFIWTNTAVRSAKWRIWRVYPHSFFLFLSSQSGARKYGSAYIQSGSTNEKQRATTTVNKGW